MKVVAALIAVTLAVSAYLLISNTHHWRDAVDACLPYKVSWPGDERAFCTDLRWHPYESR